MAFPATVLGLTFEVALSADLTAAPSTWSWTDATDYVRAAAGVVITRGGYDGSVQAPPSTCRLTLDNTDGRWVITNPSGAWYGQLKKNTPIRIVVDEGTPSVRWTGFLVELPPRWDPSENDRYVLVTAAGILRRLQRGQTPLRSALVRTISGTSRPPVAYWPGEDGSDATSIAEFFGGTPMRLTGQAHTMASDGPTGSSPLPEFTTVAGVEGFVPAHATTNEWSVLKVFKFPAAPTAETTIMQWATSGTYPKWRITLTPSGTDFLSLQAFDTTDTMQINDTSNFQANTNVEPYDQWLILSVAVSQNGADVDYEFGVFDSAGGSGQTGTETGIAAGRVTRIGEHANAKTNGMHAGHWGAWNANYGLISSGEIDPAAIGGHNGETTTIRSLRLAQEDGTIGIEVGASSAITMGPQTQASLLELFREAEAASGGRLYETRDPTEFNAYLNLKSSEDMTNVAASLTLNHDSGNLASPFDPTDDDQQLRNDWTVTRQTATGTGSSARVIATEGEHSTLTPGNVGTYDDSVMVNIEADDQLIHQAGWRVNLGTVEGLRFPSVALNLARNPSLIADWIGCDIGSRITITNPPTGIAPDDIDLLIEGWTETFGPYTWGVVLNCSPYKPWRVFQLAETAGDTDPYLGRLAEDEQCALRIAIDSSDTNWIIDPNFYRWTTEADDFPLNVRIGGEVATITSVANGASSFVAAGTPSHADNAAVSPALYAGHSLRQIIFVLAGIRSTSATLVTPTDYTRLPVFPEGSNVQLFAKVHDGSESAPTVTPTGGAAGDTVSAFTFGWTNISNTLDDLADIVVEAVAQLNASAQNIAYGGVLTRIVPSIKLVLGWKQDDYTSVAPPSGFTEIAEASTTTGNDQSLYAAYRVDTTDAVAVEGSLAVTGGASAISRSAVCAIPAGVQAFTVSARSVNGVVKSHAVGTRIEVADPAVLAL